ncbi:hypothetical protein [Micromonospora sp. WMMD710]|uniref:hypothetical protein n=1 Tax=Micromonospora sp. WMMD710 TaxID=3016085 RepID=UPI002416D0F8|nr:hypothetical protein [Micromonospora sp. WMMD710]MDG4756307.1 hypothetical protein [Micromonospora sp. WMMD710]MDG4762396.1 hypothetical protein [Micromonospora sp. WMMD710]MDG4762404.1 hypothetical protein [Micromonospora sp. WMMD710]MDG4762450.1 hypothetical protein [Micromonospora sp. WMMD710]MDG4762485.1 hypothetical protein [Micromonospora sp. WMMD710]
MTVKLTVQQALERMEERRRCVSPEGRAMLAAAVQIDHDWALPCSSEDLLIAAVAEMSVKDLEAANLLVQSLQSAITVALIKHDAARDTETRDGGA